MSARSLAFARQFAMGQALTVAHHRDGRYSEYFDDLGTTSQAARLNQVPRANCAWMTA
jgi:hypothetical protein